MSEFRRSIDRQVAHALDQRHRDTIQGRRPSTQEAVALAKRYGWTEDDPIAAAATVAYYDLADCPLDDADCMPTPEPDLGQWWSFNEALDAHLIAKKINPGDDRYLAICGVPFQPFLEAPGIALRCHRVWHYGACILCRDYVLAKHSRSCVVRGCRIVELLEEFDRGIFR